MNIYKKIENTRFSDSEMAFIKYIMENYNEITSLSVKEIAKVCYVSVSTIYRVLDKLEVNGIHELKLLLISDREYYIQERESVDYNYPFDKKATHHQIMKQMEQLYSQTVTSTFNLIDLDIYLKVVQSLYDSHNIFLFPTIGNVGIAENFRQNMLEIGVRVECESNIFYQHHMGLTCKKGDCAIFISYNNRTPHFYDVMKEVKNLGTTVILITSTKETILNTVANYHLYFSSYEDSQTKITSFSSRVSLQYLLDCLYACYFKYEYEENLNKKISNYVEY